MLRIWHFLVLKVICQATDQWNNLSMSSCSWIVSWSDVIFLYRMQSSAKRRISDVMLSETSLMYRRKSKGPRTVPCGTPDVTGSQVDWDPFTTTRCLRLDKKELIQLSVLPRIPYESILVSKRWWGTESKAFEKSKIATSVGDPESRALAQSSIASINWVSHKWPDLKPCWRGVIMLFSSRNLQILEWTICSTSKENIWLCLN